MSDHEYVPKSKFGKWFNDRLPLLTLASHLTDYPTPKNLNYWWTFGGILTFCLITQIVTGLTLAMHYIAHADMAFESVEHIMRDVNYGWLIRYIHANGASMFFLAVYIHIFRSLFYGSYKSPREIIWIIGIIIYLLMMAAAFMGYVLPWGQMSFWGATVITNLFSAIPLVGQGIVEWLWGGYSVDNPTLTRFFTLHYLIPFLILGLVVLHIWALHVPGNNNPVGIDVKKPSKDTVPFHPYIVIKDGFALLMFMIVFAFFVFYSPNILGHADNYIEANPMVTPAHIVPEWYLLPFYAILRSVPDKLMGVVAMLSAILILAALPWLDTSKIRSAVFRPLYKQFYWILVADVLILGYVGAMPAEGLYLLIARIATAYYFIHFLIILPVLGFKEKTIPLPLSITEPVLGGMPLSSTVKKKRNFRKIVKKYSKIYFLAILLIASTFQVNSAEKVKLLKTDWSFKGLFGKFDRGSLQRGYQVYSEVCASCHSMKYVSYRNLAEPGGPEFSEEQVKAIAANFEVTDGPNSDGEMFTRPAKLSDKFVMPFENVKAAQAANGGAYPPDMSVLAKARSGGVDYIYSVLLGYEDPPSDITLDEGVYYNKYMYGNKIKMSQPLMDDAVEYIDGTVASEEQMAKDVTTFLMWAAEPHLETRHKMGFKAILYLIILTILVYFSMKKIWSRIESEV